MKYGSRPPGRVPRVALLQILRGLCVLVLAWLWLPGSVQAQRQPIGDFDLARNIRNLSVVDIRIDASRTMWIGTQNGLYVDDGSGPRRWGQLQVRGVVSLLPVARGALVAGPSQIQYVVGDEVMPVLFDGRPIPLAPRGNLIVQADGSVLAAGARQLLLLRLQPDGRWTATPWFDEARLRTMPDLLSVGRLARDASGTLWLACGRHLCRQVQDRVTRVDLPDAVPGGWGQIFVASNGDLWLHDSERVLQYNPADGRWREHPQVSQAMGGSMVLRPIVQDSQGRILVALEDGLARWDGRAWTRYGPGQGLEASGISSMAFGQDGELWLGTAGQGLMVWHQYGSMTQWQRGQGLATADVWSFGQDAGHGMLVGTSDGVWRPGAHPLRIEGVKGAISALARDSRGGVWIGSLSGDLDYLPPGAKAARHITNLSFIIRILADEAGRVWIGSQFGLFVIDAAHPDVLKQADAAFNPTPGRHHGHRVMALCRSASGGGPLWMATDQGFYRLDGDQIRPLRLEGLDGRPVELVNVTAIACARSDRLWITTDAGDVWQAGVSGGRAVLTRPFEHSLQGLQLVSALEDRRGWLWLGTDAGLRVHDGRRWRWLTQDSGLVWNDCNQGALFEDDEGAIWVGTPRGASRIEHPQWMMDSAAQQAPLLQLSHDGRPLPAGSSIHLQWDRVPLHLHAAGGGFIERQQRRYWFRLDGWSERWQSSDVPEWDLPALQPGHYTLESWMENPALGQRTPIARVDLQVANPWWRTPWALSLAAMLLLMAVLLVGRAVHHLRLKAIMAARRRLEHEIGLRTEELQQSREALRRLGQHQLEVLESERQRVARELHDELGQQLAALKMEISMLGLRSDLGQPVGKAMFSALVSRVDLIVQEVRAVVSRLRPTALDGGLSTGLEWLIGQHQDLSGQRCLLRIRGDSTQLSADQKIALFRIAQECLTNALRHSRARNVVVELRCREPGRWDFSVHDDGIGLPDADPPTGHGMAGMRERAQMIGARLSVVSLPGQGCTVRVSSGGGHAPDRMEDVAAAQQPDVDIKGR